MMVDPDAPTPEAPTAGFFLHWMATNMVSITAPQDIGALKGQSVLTNSTPNVVDYIPPGPPATSSAHRYILYAFQQPANFVLPAQFATLNNANRVKFDVNAFVQAANLGAPVAANYMYVSAQADVPPTFQAPPLGTFPGGNGNAIGLPGSPLQSNVPGQANAVAAAPAMLARVATGAPLVLLPRNPPGQGAPGAAPPPPAGPAVPGFPPPSPPPPPAGGATPPPPPGSPATGGLGQQPAPSSSPDGLGPVPIEPSSPNGLGPAPPPTPPGAPGVAVTDGPAIAAEVNAGLGIQSSAGRLNADGSYNRAFSVFCLLSEHERDANRNNIAARRDFLKYIVVFAGVFAHQAWLL